MRARATLIATVVLVTALGGASFGATKAVCNLVTDPAGDSFILASQPPLPAVPYKDDALDLLGADFGSNDKSLTAAIRLTKASPKASSAPTGWGANIYFTATGSEAALYMRADINDAGDVIYEYGYDDAVNGLTPLGTGSGVFDSAKNEIRITAPLKGFAEQAAIKTGTKLSITDLTTSRNIVVALVYSDRADAAAKTYTVGTKSCVTVGK